MCKAITHKRLLKQISKTSFPPTNLHCYPVHYNSFRTARKESRFGLTTFVMKWMSRYTATGKVMVKRKARQSATCPRCHHPDEDILYILTCPSISPTSLRKSLLYELRMWIQANQTHPIIVHFIYKCLTKWFKNTSYK